MKRVILGLLMLGGFALAAAPAHANFNLNAECNSNYAIEIHGTEPELSADSALHYIAGVGQLSLGPQSGSISTGDNNCNVTGGELIYNDNDLLTFTAGPAACYLAESLLGGGIPCFDGGTHVTGNLVQAPDGGAILNLVWTFGWTNGGPGASSLPMSFNLQGNAGASWVLGNSVPDPGPNPSSPPPGSPVLVLQMQKQALHSTISLPVTGPLPPQTLPVSCLGCTPPSLLTLGSTGGGGNGYGVAPYLGLSISLFQGYGAPSGDAFSQPIQGSFGTTLSSLQIFANGQAGGSASFSSNDNVGNTTGATNDDCDTIVTQTGNFADGASNDGAALVHPSLACADATLSPGSLPGTLGGAAFMLSAVVWGPTDSSTYTTTTGLASTMLTGGAIVPVGLESDATGLFSVPAGGVNNLVFTSITSVNNNTASFPFVEFFSTTPAGCDVSIAMPSATATNTGASQDAACTGLHTPEACCTSAGHGTCVNETCSLELDNLSNVATNPVNAVVEGDSFPFSKYAFEKCTCNGTVAGTVSSPLTITSSDCPLSGTTSYTVTCKN